MMKKVRISSEFDASIEKPWAEFQLFLLFLFSFSFLFLCVVIWMVGFTGAVGCN